MNYRHAFHAGNFGDVLKHAVLALAIGHLKGKDTPFRVIDTHAGTGMTDLAGAAAEKTLEWQSGIGRLIGPGAPPLPDAIAAVLAPYLDQVRAANADGQLAAYPGSPAIARGLLRVSDRLLLNELHPQDCAALRALMRRDARVKVLEEDGFVALRSVLPPPERRALVLIDPPYEQKHELARIASELEGALRRFATGTYIVWYPVKDLAPVNAFYRQIEALELGKALRVDLYIRKPVEPDQLNGCGLLVINPPFTLAGQLKVLLPFLAERLGQGAAGGWKLESVGGRPRRRLG